MTLQTTAVLISGLGVTLVFAAFAYVVRGAGEARAYAEVQPRAYRFRSRLFWGLLALGGVVASLTLGSLPYGSEATGRAATVVEVTGGQWYWEMSAKEVPVNRPVRFRVKSRDVNHGFAIYDPERRILAQVQVMPGYENELTVEFPTPGTHQILCLEYCGAAHHGMVASFDVVAAPNAKEAL